MYTVKSPVLFLVFNRLDYTRRVFEQIMKARPAKLYIACDGPRPGVAGELERVESVREFVLQNINWPCEVSTLFQVENQGCKDAVTDGLSWFFSLEEQGIILEDDCLPEASFFQFCDELLVRYRFDESVMSISGYSCLSPGKNKLEDSYFFSKYFHCWGWASWRRAWATYDKGMRSWYSVDKSSFLDNIDRGWLFKRHWRKVFDKVADGQIDTWDFQMVFNVWMKGGLCCIPATNLVSNIGFGPQATHTRDLEDKNANLDVRRLTFPLRHPSLIRRNKRLDKWVLKQAYGISLAAFVRRKLNYSLSSLRNRLRGQ